MSPLETVEPTKARVDTDGDIFEEHPDLKGFKSEDELKSEWAQEDAALVAAEADLQSPAGAAPEVQPAFESQVVPTEHAKRIEQVRQNLAPRLHGFATPPALPPAPSTPKPSKPQPSAGSPEFTLAIVDRSVDARTFAGKARDERLSRETNSGGFFKRAIQTFWKKGSVNEAYRQKYLRDEERNLVDSQDVLLNEGTAAQREQAEKDLLERFKRQEDAYRGAGETRNALAQESELGGKLRGLILEAARGQGEQRMSNEELLTRYHEIISEHPDELEGEGKITVNNIQDVVEAMRGANMHQEALKHAVDNMSIVTGESRSGGRTQEAHKSASDKVIEWLGKSKFTSFIPEPALSAGISAIYIGGKLTRSTAAKAAGLALPGLLGGAIGYARERKRTKDDIAQHEAEFEMGKEFTPDNQERSGLSKVMYNFAVKHRERLEELMYNSKFATDLTEALRNGIASLEEGSEDALVKLMHAVGETHALRGLSEREEDAKPLIRYHGATQEDREKIDLIDAHRDASALIMERLGTLDAATREQLELPENAEITDVLAAYAKPYIDEALEDIEAKDRARKAYVRKRALGVGAVKGALTSVGIGLVADGIIDLASSSSGSGSFTELPMKDQHNNTSINGGYTTSESALNGHHTMNINGPDGKPALTGIPLNNDGTLPQSSQNILHDHGFGLTSHEAPNAAPVDRQVTIQDYLKDHPDKGRNFDSVTLEHPSSNEQGGHLTGNKDGSVNWWTNMNPNSKEFDIAIAKPDGTHTHMIFERGQPVPKDIASMLYQKSDGTWGIKGQGNYMAWGNVNGNNFDVQASIGGTGVAPTVTDHMPGTGTHTTYEITVPHHETGGGENAPGVGVVAAPGRANLAPIGRRSEKSAEEEGPTAPELPPAPDQGELSPAKEKLAIEAAPAGPGQGPELPPKKARLELEAAPADRKQGGGAPGELGGGDGPRAIETAGASRAVEGKPDRLEGRALSLKESFGRDRMAELRRNPNAQVELQKALDWHDSLVRTKDPEFARRIDTIIEQPNMNKLGIDTDAIMPFVINAVDDADSIYDTLKYYGEYSKRGKSMSRLLLNVTWTDLDEGENQAKIIQTLSAIDRIMAEYPDLRISTFDTVLEQAKLDGGEYGGRSLEELGEETLFEVAMAATRKAIQNDDRDANKDVLILRRPFNVSTLDSTYERNMVEAFERNPQKDTFSGSVRWGRDSSYEKSPSLAFVTNFMEVTKIMGRKTRKPGFKPLFAANMGYRLSTVAAVGGGGHYAEERSGTQRTYDLAIGERIAATRNPSRVPSRRQPQQQGSQATASDQTTSTDRNSNDFNMHVTRAQIDADPSLFERTFRSGKPITDAVFDMRRGVASDDLPEEVGDDRIADVKNVERGISDIINKLRPSETEYRSALAFMLPMDDVTDEQGAVIRRLPRYKIKTGKGGRKAFYFTEDGRDWLLGQFNNNPLYRASE